MTSAPARTNRPLAPYLALFATLWLVLVGRDPWSWLIGIPSVLAAALLARRRALSADVTVPVPDGGSDARTRLSMTALVGFLPFFLWQSLRGGLDVTWRVLRLRPRVAPGFRAYRLRLSALGAQVFLVNAISLMPGTLSADLRAGVVLIHCLDTSVDHSATLRRLEARVARLFPVEPWPAPTATRSSNLRELLTRGVGALRVLLGQAAVSLANFATVLMIGRWAGKEELGLYALGLSAYFLAVSVSDTLVATPYTYFRVQPDAGQRALVRAALAGTLLIAALLASILTLLWWQDWSALAHLWPVLPLALLLALLREFLRRHLVAVGALSGLLWADLLGAVTQLTGVFALGMSGLLSATTAWWTIAGAALAVLLVATNPRRVKRLAQPHCTTAAVLRDYLRYGRWLLIGGIVHVAAVQLYPWLALVGGGEALAGLYAACIALVNLIGPLLLGLSNYFRPRLMAAYLADPRPTHYARYVASRGLLFLAPAVAVALVLGVAGDALLELIYGEGFREAGPALAWMGLGMTAVAMAAPAQLALLAMHRPASTLYYHLAALVPLLILAYWLRDGLDIIDLGRVYGITNLFATLVITSLFWGLLYSRGRAPAVLANRSG